MQYSVHRKYAPTTITSQGVYFIRITKKKMEKKRIKNMNLKKLSPDL